MMTVLDLRTVALALGGDVVGGQVIAPGPGHSSKDRSLAILLDPTKPDGFVVCSHADHAKDDWKKCRDYVRSRLGLPPWEPGDEQRRTITRQHIQKWDLAAVEGEVDESPRAFDEDDLQRITRAQSIWDEAWQPRGTLAENYLREGRKLDLPDELVDTVLRFHPFCPWRNEATGKIDRVPALIAAFRSVDDDAITGIHRIRLDQPERWPKADRRMLGIVRHAAVKLDPVGDTLAVGEGVKTCMAARQLGYGPVWALGSVGAIGLFPLIDGVGCLRLLREAGEASKRDVELCSRRWHKAGRRVQIVMPDAGHGDLNDELMTASGSS
jgi:putative DNA primase/helicase